MKLGLVLSGGGALGAFEAGVVAAMEEAGLRPDVLSGTSAGALNVAALGAGFDARGLAELWSQVGNREVFTVRDDFGDLLRLGDLLRPDGRPLTERVLDGIGWAWLFETAPLRETLVAALGGEQVPADDRPLVVSAVEVASGALVRFATQAPARPASGFRVGPLTVDHLMASAAIPLAFQPAEVEGVAYWDGGIVANTPLAPALAYHPDVVVIVTTSTLARPAPVPTSLGDAISVLVDTLLAHSLAADLDHAKAINALVAANPDALPDRRVVEFLELGPVGLDLGPRGLLDFDPAKAARYIALGHQAGAGAITTWHAEGRLPS